MIVFKDKTTIFNLIILIIKVQLIVKLMTIQKSVLLK